MNTCHVDCQHAPLSQSPFKAVPDVSYSEGSPSSDQNHSKVTPALGRRENNHTHQFHCISISKLEEDIYYDCWPCPLTKTSQGASQMVVQTGGQISLTTGLVHQWKPLSEQYRESPLKFWEMSWGKTSGLTHLRPKTAPNFFLNSTVTKLCPQGKESHCGWLDWRQTRFNHNCTCIYTQRRHFWSSRFWWTRDIAL